jgi:hypothetical protein
MNGDAATFNIGHDSHEVNKNGQGKDLSANTRKQIVSFLLDRRYIENGERKLQHGAQTAAAKFFGEVLNSALGRSTIQ